MTTQYRIMRDSLSEELAVSTGAMFYATDLEEADRRLAIARSVWEGEDVRIWIESREITDWKEAS